jgi:hypothetical protein
MRPRNPAMPSASYRVFQVAIVCGMQSTRSQIVEDERPSVTEQNDQRPSSFVGTPAVRTRERLDYYHSKND